ncbi:MAG: phosphomannose isomerase type II C-terminal cupin domain [Candidatus Melainabacteria bacterium]|jgi:mannose-6-phosphate isomerase-like protein (cupin superfamily)|nr:phosphomannose isomerase type II C-terminal cupin domain [Candidatus Melainabacteria bacterium]
MDEVKTEDGQTTVRPWGKFIVLADLHYTKVKRLIVNPGQRLSLQSHKLRDEHWVIVRGTARVTLDDETRDVGYGEHVFVKRGTKHRIANAAAEPVELVEVQVGDAFPEEDIERFQDDYNRTSSS